MRKLLTVIFFISVIIEAISQSWGDTVYIGLRGGLNLLEEPFENSYIIDSLHFNDKVVIRDQAQLDTINLRVANWINVVTLNNKSGWVFGGYVNHEVLPTKEYSSLRAIANDLLSGQPNFLFKDTVASSEEQNIKTIYGEGNEFYFLIIESVWENGISELNLYEWNLNEIINLIALSSWNGKNVEFDLLKESVHPSNLYRFEWLNGFDDPEQKMVLEKRYPRGVRFIMDGLY